MGCVPEKREQRQICTDNAAHRESPINNEKQGESACIVSRPVELQEVAANENLNSHRQASLKIKVSQATPFFQQRWEDKKGSSPSKSNMNQSITYPYQYKLFQADDGHRIGILKLHSQSSDSITVYRNRFIDANTVAIRKISHAQILQRELSLVNDQNFIKIVVRCRDDWSKMEQQ